MLGAEKMHTVCPMCVIRVREAYRRVVVMGEVCASTSEALSKHIPMSSVLIECAMMLGQAAQCADIFKRGMQNGEETSGDGGTRDVSGRVTHDGKEGRQEDRPEEEDGQGEEESVQRVREALLIK